MRKNENKRDNLILTNVINVSEHSRDFIRRISCVLISAVAFKSYNLKNT